MVYFKSNKKGAIVMLKLIKLKVKEPEVVIYEIPFLILHFAPASGSQIKRSVLCI